MSAAGHLHARATVELLDVGVGNGAEAAVVSLPEERLVQHGQAAARRRSRMAAARSV